MVQFAVPNSDPIASLTFEDIVTVDISTLTGAGDYISLSLPEFIKAKYTLASTFLDITSNEKGNFGVGPTDHLAFSEGTFVNTQPNGDTELRFPISKLTTVNKAEITGVRFRLVVTEETTFRCLSIRACSSTWKYATVDMDTLWHRITRPPSPNGSKALRTNLIPNPSFEVNTTGWSLSSGNWTSASRNREEVPEVMGNEHSLWACQVKGVKDATTTARFLILETLAGTSGFPVTAGTTYTLSGLVYAIDPSARPTQNFIVEITWYKAAGTEISQVSAPTLIKKEVLTRPSITATAPAEAAFAKARFTSWSETASDEINVWIDQVQFEAASTLTEYFDGNYEGAYWNGTANQSSSSAPETAFPTKSGSLFPSVFRSALMSGLTDPEPVNLVIGSAFTTGSYIEATGSKKNELAFFFRDVPTDNQTMIEVDTKKMADLELANAQPDFGHALFDARDQEEIDLYTQEELDSHSQYNLERKRDESEHTWMEVRLKWGAERATNQLVIYNADGVGYKWTNFELEASAATNLDNGRYILITTIKNQWMRAEIYKLNQTGEFVSAEPVFDTGKVLDDTLIKRRKGRFGWQAALLDGDAHIDNIKTRGTNFGEMISKEYRSITPVKGVQLYAGSTTEKELISGFEPTSTENMTLTLDPSASSGGKAVRVTVTPLKPLQGIASNTFNLDDPSNIRISFDIKFPSSEIAGGGLSVYLLGDYQAIYPLNVSNFVLDSWTHVKCELPTGKYQTGGYKLLLIQSLPVVATSWWVENLSAKTYTVKWSARPHKSDAWNEEGSRWLEAGFTLNSLNGGVVFPEHGSGLQVRAQALRQEAVISDFKAIPQYATLGRIVFKN